MGSWTQGHGLSMKPWRIINSSPETIARDSRIGRDVGVIWMISVLLTTPNLALETVPYIFRHPYTKQHVEVISNCFDDNIIIPRGDVREFKLSDETKGQLLKKVARLKKSLGDDAFTAMLYRIAMTDLNGQRVLDKARKIGQRDNLPPPIMEELNVHLRDEGMEVSVSDIAILQTLIIFGRVVMEVQNYTDRYTLMDLVNLQPLDLKRQQRLLMKRYMRAYSQALSALNKRRIIEDLSPVSDTDILVNSICENEEGECDIPLGCNYDLLIHGLASKYIETDNISVMKNIELAIPSLCVSADKDSSLEKREKENIIKRLKAIPLYAMADDLYNEIAEMGVLSISMVSKIKSRYGWHIDPEGVFCDAHHNFTLYIRAEKQGEEFIMAVYPHFTSRDQHGNEYVLPYLDNLSTVIMTKDGFESRYFRLHTIDRAHLYIRFYEFLRYHPDVANSVVSEELNKEIKDFRR